jgi:hypothetical protein
VTRLSSEMRQRLKGLINRVKALEGVVEGTLYNPSATEITRYASYRTMASRYNSLLNEAAELVPLPKSAGYFDTSKMKSQFDTLPSYQKEVLESVLLETRMLQATLETDADFSNDEIDTLSDFIQSHLREVIFDTPSNEREVQNALETLFVGRGLTKGIDFRRESGEVEFSGKGYVPDFCIDKYSLAIEVKLIKDPSVRSRIIEEITADITAYAKEYDSQLFVVYDIGSIQSVLHFKSDIEQCDGVRIIVVKH